MVVSTVFTKRRFCNEEDKGALGDDEQYGRALDRDYIRSPQLVSWEEWSLGEGIPLLQRKKNGDS